MTKRPHKTQKTQVKLQELVVVTFAEDMEQAKDYESLLKTNDIPTLVKEHHESKEEGSGGIAVMVPEDYLDEAHVIIESQDAYDDFYDLALDDEDVDEFDDDFFNEDF